MRITNKMTTNNLLLNLNKNTERLNKLQIQIATGQKIQSASEDPIVAALALKFRTNVASATQYKKNAQQAQSWMEVTETALLNSDKIMRNIYELCVQGSSDEANTDRNTIINQLTELRNQLRSEANSTYSGRYVFSGFKTDQKPIFDSDVNKKYNITQNFNKDNIEGITQAVVKPNDNSRETETVQRIKIAYKNVTNIKFTDLNDNPIAGIPEINDSNTVVSGDYDAYNVGDDDIKYLKDTGEILLGKNVAEALKNAGIDAGTDKDDLGNFKLNYDKSGFQSNDLNPRVYFDCTEYVDGNMQSSTILPTGLDINDILAINDKSITPTITTSNSAENAKPLGSNEVRYLKDTGEILFGANVLDNLPDSFEINGETILKSSVTKYSDLKIPALDGQTGTDITLTYNTNETPSNQKTKNLILATSTGTPAVGDNDIVYLTDTGKFLYGKNIAAELADPNSFKISYPPKTTRSATGNPDNSKGLGNYTLSTDFNWLLAPTDNIDINTFTLDLKVGEKILSINPSNLVEGSNPPPDKIGYAGNGLFYFGSDIVNDLKNQPGDPSDIINNGTTVLQTESFNNVRINSTLTTDANLEEVKIEAKEDITVTSMTLEESKNAAPVGDNEIRYISDTGELLLGKNVAAEGAKTPSNLTISYPNADGTQKTVPLETRTFKKIPDPGDEIKYEFGVDNKMTVNTNASVTFTVDLISDLDDLINTISGIKFSTEDQIKERLKQRLGENEYSKLTEDDIKKEIEEVQAGEEKTFRKVMGDKFSASVGKFQKHNEQISLSDSEIGSRLKRLELISDRLLDDYTNYSELMSKNEGIEFEEVYLDFMTQQSVYNSALSVGSKIIQKSLVDFV